MSADEHCKVLIRRALSAIVALPKRQLSIDTERFPRLLRNEKIVSLTHANQFTGFHAEAIAQHVRVLPPDQGRGLNTRDFYLHATTTSLSPWISKTGSPLLVKYFNRFNHNGTVSQYGRGPPVGRRRSLMINEAPPIILPTTNRSPRSPQENDSCVIQRSSRFPGSATCGQRTAGCRTTVKKKKINAIIRETWMTIVYQ